MQASATKLREEMEQFGCPPDFSQATEEVSAGAQKVSEENAIVYCRQRC
jgi:hypothetical protein